MDATIGCFVDIDLLGPVAKIPHTHIQLAGRQFILFKNIYICKQNTKLRLSNLWKKNYKFIVENYYNLWVTELN